MQRLTRPAIVLVLALAAAAALIAPVRYWDGGLIEIEATQFVRQYLDDRTVLQKVFDPHGNDLGTYQARELSYFIDYLDARVFEASMLAHRPLFVPLSALMASVLTLAVGIGAMWRLPPPVRLTAALLLLVYVTNYVHLVTMGILYRSAKPLLAPVLMATVVYLLAVCSGDQRSPLSGHSRRRLAPVIVFVLFSTMSLLDRQGFYYAVAGSAALGIAAARGWTHRRDVVLAGAAAVVVMVFYNLVLGPALVQQINGYSPSFEYQRVPWQDLFRDPWITARSMALVLQSVASLSGGAPPAMAGIAVSMLIAFMWIRGRLSRGMAASIVLVALMQIGLVALMVARHPPIYAYYDHRVWYYPLPFQALLVALLIHAVGRRASAGIPLRTAAVNLVLLIVVAGNLAHWDDYRRAQLRSHWFPDMYMQNLALKASFADRRPRPSLSPEFYAFFEFFHKRIDSR